MQLNIALSQVTEFHKHHVSKYECETWDQYLEEVKLYTNYSNKNQHLRIYLEYCEQKNNTSKKLE
jgi:hypothetical protein